MFEAKLSEGLILKKIVDSIKDIVTDVNIDISPQGKAPSYPHERVRANLSSLIGVFKASH
jgi:hypothetical protein